MNKMRFNTDDRYKGDGRLFFEDPKDRDNVAVFFANAADGLTVSVSEEHAVDSYNDTFECTFYLNEDQAKKLQDLLNSIWPVSEPGAKKGEPEDPPSDPSKL